jgi:hypothetical protein
MEPHPVSAMIGALDGFHEMIRHREKLMRVCQANRAKPQAEIYFRQALDIAHHHQPGPPVAVVGQAPGGLRPTCAGVRVGVRHGGPEGRKGVAGGTRMRRSDLVIKVRLSHKKRRPFAHPCDTPIVFQLVVPLRAA